MLKPYAHVIHSSLHENIVRPFSFELTKYADQSKLRGLEAAPVIETLKHLTSCSLLAEATLSHLSKLLHRSVQSMLQIMQSCFACLRQFTAQGHEFTPQGHEFTLQGARVYTPRPRVYTPGPGVHTLYAMHAIQCDALQSNAMHCVP